MKLGQVGMEEIKMNKRAYDLRFSSFVSAFFLLAIGLFTACRSSDSHFAPVGESGGLASSVQASLNGNPATEPQSQNPPPGGMTKVALNHQFDPAWLKPSPELFTLGPGDRVEIELLGEAGSRATTVVAPDGKIYFNLL